MIEDDPEVDGIADASVEVTGLAFDPPEHDFVQFSDPGLGQHMTATETEG